MDVEKTHGKLRKYIVAFGPLFIQVILPWNIYYNDLAGFLTAPSRYNWSKNFKNLIYFSSFCFSWKPGTWKFRFNQLKFSNIKRKLNFDKVQKIFYPFVRIGYLLALIVQLKYHIVFGIDFCWCWLAWIKRVSRLKLTNFKSRDMK